MIFRIAFLLFAFISIICLTIAIRAKRRNIGFLIMTVLVIACDIICFVLLGCKSVVNARNILTAYYICHAWFYFGSLLMVSALGKRRNYKRYGIPTLLICIYQTVLMASNLLRSRIMSLSRHLLLGGAWWVAEDSKAGTDSPSFLSFQTYRILIFINVIIILCIMIAGCIRSAKMFRARFYALITIHIIFVAVEVVTSVRSLPVWIICLVMNIICVIGLYFTCYYCNRKLQDSSLMNFANEMSDGFILYNEYNDLIHMNDLLRNTIPDELIESFANKNKLDEWISNTIIVDNIEVLKCENNGESIFYKVRKNELKENDDFLGTIYILHDTTESILKMHAMEEANIELERAAKMKSDFLANMSHEIRTPMNAVIGMAEIALREQLPANVRDYLSQIQSSGRNLLNIINDILDFSKIEAGKMEIIPDRYEPISEINDIANVLATRIGDKKLELFVISDNTIPHALEGDIMRIRQILINLANNAIKFTKQGMVLVQILCEKTSDDEVMLTFHVIDTGQGIKKEDLDKLFVSFQQVDSKRNRSVEGTGLGLAISQRLCEAMGGNIGVKSEYGKGSDFYFNIPQKIIDPAFDIVVEDADKKHACVINDNPEMLDMFLEEMNKLGVDGRVIRSLSEFEPSSETDFLFFEEDRYDDEIRSYIDSHKNVIGVILVPFDSTYVADIDNLRVMRRPETTLSMVMILNGREFSKRATDSSTAFKIDFVAPDARILIVDDNAINITIAEGLLEPTKVECVGALSGREAMDILAQKEFDVVFMDHMMPEMDGVETTRMIRDKIPSVADTPIIALTANAMEGVKEMFFDAGMNDFVAKPIDIRELITKLKQWLPQDKMLRDTDEHDIAGQNESANDADSAVSDNTMIKYDGLNNEKAIQALGTPELYQTIVKEYYRSGNDKYNEIKQAYDREDWDDYTIKVHALKSSSRQIGADSLGEMAEQLELAGKNRDMNIIYDRTEETLNEYRALLDKLSVYFDDETVNADDLPLISADELESILEKLIYACDELDMDEMEKCEEELKKYSFKEEQDMVYKLCDAIDNIDVDTCLDIIESIRNGA